MAICAVNIGYKERKRAVATACESFQSGTQTWRTEGCLLWTFFFDLLISCTLPTFQSGTGSKIKAPHMIILLKFSLNFTCLRSTDPGGGIGYVPSLNSQSNFFCWILKFFFINLSCLYFVYCFFSFKNLPNYSLFVGPWSMLLHLNVVIRWQQVFFKDLAKTATNL